MLGRVTSARTRTSAGLLLYRRSAATTDGVEVLIGHLGGPLWARKEARAWSIPKGEYGPDEPPLDAARREFREELGQPPPPGDYVPLGTVTHFIAAVARAVRESLHQYTASAGSMVPGALATACGLHSEVVWKWWATAASIA